LIGLSLFFWCFIDVLGQKQAEKQVFWSKNINHDFSSYHSDQNLDKIGNAESKHMALKKKLGAHRSKRAFGNAGQPAFSKFFFVKNYFLYIFLIVLMH
jgi:hypothetical protein